MFNIIRTETFRKAKKRVKTYGKFKKPQENKVDEVADIASGFFSPQ